MNKENNIEEIFRSTFQAFEAPVDPSVWTAVQSGISANAGASAVAAKASTGILKTIIISSATLITGLGIGYVFFSGEDKEKSEAINNTTTARNETNTAEVNTSNNNPESNSNKMIDMVVPVENESTGKKEIIKISVLEKQFLNKAENNGFSEEEKEAWEKYYEERDKEKLNAIKPEILVDKNIKTETPKIINTPETEQTIEGRPLAAIKSSDDAGTAPFVVKFSNATEENSYFWDFGDGNTSTDAEPEHIYRESGTFTVRLTVKNKSGKTDNNKKTIEVFEGAEITLVPNVFSPNNDGVNDSYKVIGKNIVLFNLRIFNTKGVLLFQTSDIENGWNGEDLKGNAMPEGNYLVRIEAVGKNNNRIVKNEVFRIER